MTDYTSCPDPECGTVAEVVDVYYCESTEGLVRHVATTCVARHSYVVAE